MSEIDHCTPSPSSSPSLAPVDSSPPSSPCFEAAFCTPPASPGAKDPFAGSTKSSKRPRIYELNESRRAAPRIDSFARGYCELDAAEALTRSTDLDDATPTRVVDPFSGSAKRAWRPPTYEKKKERVVSSDAAFSTSSSLSYSSGPVAGGSPTPAGREPTMLLDDPDDDFLLTDDEHEVQNPPAKPETREELEARLWDEAITRAIDKVNGMIDLSSVGLNKGLITHIPASIADLGSLVVLPPTQPALSSAPSSPNHSPKQLSPSSHHLDSAFSQARPFIRATTLPAAVFNEAFLLRSKDGERLRGTPAARAASLQSVPQPSTHLRRREIEMYLANNVIQRLPAELFCVTSLTVLSLRSNALTTIPPQIVQLTALKELNLAQNKLQWLPAEMLSMHLTKLALAGNPWIPLPSTSHSESAQPPGIASRNNPPLRRRRPVSETIAHYAVPPLSETCFRALLAPYSPNTPHILVSASTHHPAVRSSSEQLQLNSSDSRSSTTNAQSHPTTPPPLRPLTVLEATYALPLTEDHNISPSLLTILRTCVPAAVAKPATATYPSGRSKVRRDEGQRDVHDDVFSNTFSHNEAPHDASTLQADAPDPPTISVCPSPAHHGQSRMPVFVRPAEERFTWEDIVAGVQVGADGIDGVGVPVRWRGCRRGCLAFLDPEPEPVHLPPAPGVDGLAALSADDGDVEMFDDEHDVADMQEVRFDGGLADLEDFEEGF
ncbi:hypothetical protein C8Q79DRAFT_1002184 [Trametes meyenii]|nr:hypothetical protein C8Q79DRAFT_1002184 [Trametes meyenii]